MTAGRHSRLQNSTEFWMTDIESVPPVENCKLVVFDLDGTLLTANYELTRNTIRAVDRIRDLGMRITVATGRSHKSAKPFVNRLGIVEPMVFSNGSVYDNPATGEREVVCGIPLETALIILMLRDRYDISLKIHTSGDAVYKSDNTPWPGEGIHFETGTVVENLKAELTEDPIKIVFYADKEQHRKFQTDLMRILGENSPIALFNTHPLRVEAVNRNVSKGKTVLRLAEQLGIYPKEVIAVGDQENDYEMLRDSGIGIMVGSAAPLLKKVCSRTIPEPENDGISQLSDWLQEARCKRR